MPLAQGTCSSEEARRALEGRSGGELFPSARAPEAARVGLYVYVSCLDEAHRIAQDVGSAEGSFWHGIVHRQEPDAGNASYWFRRVGQHAIFPALAESAGEIASRFPAAGLQFGGRWDPFAFIDITERARKQPGSSLESAALEIQRAEWQLLFDWCARSAG